MIEKKDIILSAVCICLGAGIGFGAKSMLIEENEQKPAVSEVQQKEIPEKNDYYDSAKQAIAKQEVDNPASYADIAVQYIKTVKTGKSTDIYSDRLAKMKENISDSLYERLSPNMSEEEIEEERKQAENLDKDSITTTKVTDTDYSYKKIEDNIYEISVIYTQRISLAGNDSTQRYLCRMKVEKQDDAYVITNIYEDSMLSDGTYN